MGWGYLVGLCIEWRSLRTMATLKHVYLACMYTDQPSEGGTALRRGCCDGGQSIFSTTTGSKAAMKRLNLKPHPQKLPNLKNAVVHLGRQLHSQNL